jgi:hypothetical protein
MHMCVPMHDVRARLWHAHHLPLFGSTEAAHIEVAHLDNLLIWCGAVLKVQIVVVESALDEVGAVIFLVIQPHNRRDLCL